MASAPAPRLDRSSDLPVSRRPVSYTHVSSDGPISVGALLRREGRRASHALDRPVVPRARDVRNDESGGTAHGIALTAGALLALSAVIGTSAVGEVTQGTVSAADQTVGLPPLGRGTAVIPAPAAAGEAPPPPAAAVPPAATALAALSEGAGVEPASGAGIVAQALTPPPPPPGSAGSAVSVSEADTVAVPVVRTATDSPGSSEPGGSSSQPPRTVISVPGPSNPAPSVPRSRHRQLPRLLPRRLPLRRHRPPHPRPPRRRLPGQPILRPLPRRRPSVAAGSSPPARRTRRPRTATAISPTAAPTARPARVPTPAAPTMRAPAVRSPTARTTTRPRTTRRPTPRTRSLRTALKTGRRAPPRTPAPRPSRPIPPSVSRPTPAATTPATPPATRPPEVPPSLARQAAPTTQPRYAVLPGSASTDRRCAGHGRRAPLRARPNERRLDSDARTGARRDARQRTVPVRWSRFR